MGVDGVGSIRELFLVLGILVIFSVELLEIFDDENYVFSFRVLKGGYCL